MAVHTLDDLINKTASILGKLVAGEALGIVEYNTIKGCVDDVVDEVASIVAITDTNEIPGKYFLTIARLLAVHAAAEFSNTPLDLAAIQQHEGRLRYLAAADPTFETLKTEYY